MLKQSLKKRIISPIIILLILLVISIVAYPSMMFSDYVRTHNRELVDLAGKHIRDYMHICEHTTRVAAISESAIPDIVKATKERDTKELIRLLTPKHELYGVDFFVVTDEVGKILARTHDPDNFELPGWMILSIENAFNGAVYTSFMNGIVAKVSTSTCAPIYDADDVLIGVIVAGIRLDDSEALEKLKGHIGADFSIYYGDKVLNTTIMKDGKPITDRYIDPKIADTVLRDKKEFIGITQIMGESYCVYYLPLVNPRGEVFAIISAEHSNEAFNNTESDIIVGGVLIGILGLTCSVLVLLLIIANIIEPVSQLKSLVLEVANGNICTDVNKPAFTEDEIGILISNVYYLIDIISSMAGDLSRLKQNLSLHNDLNFHIDTSKYSGVYKEIIEDVETLCNSISAMHKVMTTIDNMDVMTIVIDLDYHLIFVNHSLAKTFDFDINDYRGKKCHKTLRNLDEPCPICLLPGMIDDKEKLPYQDYDFLYDDIFCIWLGGRGAIIRWIDGSYAYFQTLSDVTERKRAQEQLTDALEAAEAASKAKSNFLANISHELRTPLNVIIGLAELQLEDENTPDIIKENLHKINRAGDTLLCIINDILDISKIESGKFALAPVEYHMASLLNDTAILITSRIGEKPITFNLDIKEDLPSRLYGDDLRVKQILYNLLGNAIKYTNSGSIELGINCVREGDNDMWMEIIVRDTGVGISPEGLEKLFSDYNQVDTRANRKVEGTGLGLAITKNLVDNMDGTITVDSVYGVGSTFRVRIKQGYIEDAPPIGSAIVNNLRSFRYGENKRNFATNLVRADLSFAKVLIVDDMHTNLNVSAGLMRKYKMQADCVTSGQAAIDRIMLAEPIYNAIFMDHMMPGMDGIEATDRIRAIGTDYARTIPIIALTANVIAGTEELFYEHGFQAYITKPIDVMRLDTIVQRWIKNNNDNSLDITPNSENASETSTLDSPEEEHNIEIPGLDINKGLLSCSGDMSIYLSVLRAYVDDVFEVIDKIRDVNENTLPIYSISVHGIKGSSAIIGAEKLSELAANLELMAKSGDITGVIAHNDNFLKETEYLLSTIQDWLNKYDEK